MRGSINPDIKSKPIFEAELFRLKSPNVDVLLETALALEERRAASKVPPRLKLGQTERIAQTNLPDYDENYRPRACPETIEYPLT